MTTYVSECVCNVTDSSYSEHIRNFPPVISWLSADLGLGCCAGFNPVVVSGGRPPAVPQGLLPWLASVAVLWGTQALAVGAHGLSLPSAHGVFPEQGSNRCLLCR